MTLLKLMAYRNPSSGAVIVNGQNIMFRKLQRCPICGASSACVPGPCAVDRNVFQNVLLLLQITGFDIRSSARGARSAGQSRAAGQGKGHAGHLVWWRAATAVLGGAVVHRPSVLLADEPTGNRDEASAGDPELFHFNQVVTVVVATHDRAVHARLRDAITVAGGKVIEGPVAV
jgi:cell division transport system ATP-binding protein